jgi:heme-degrading monooxygenase HmoA
LKFYSLLAWVQRALKGLLPRYDRSTSTSTPSQFVSPIIQTIQPIQQKEAVMAIKVLIKRRFKEGHFDQIEKMIKQVRYGAMDQKGYISSETLWDHEDPFRVVIASTWQNKQSWDAWRESSVRRQRERKFEACLDGETTYELFDLGIYPH